MQASFDNDILDHEGSLESQHVIELQAFIERRTWIEEKIKFLESLQPIEVFAGAGELSTSKKLTTFFSSAQLAEWLTEHDKIERETEVFNSGDLQKLKRFTKAATQRNLSAEDTDLIELTLTTIYALDKLLHLLRDRSEKLDLLSLRLSWEEHRANCWTERHAILNDLRGLLQKYAEIYINIYRDHTTSKDLLDENPSLYTKISDNAFDTASYTTPTKVSENMAFEASSLYKRITSLKEGDVTRSAQILDKLVNDSRVPVPESFLDEQDRIDDECDNELDELGDFCISIAIQWKRAYEFHDELLQDERRADELIQDLKIALSHHPNSDQNNAFVSRVENLKSLLHSRNVSAISHIRYPPCLNLIVPDQADTNKKIFQSLKAQLSRIIESSKETEKLAKEYNGALEIIKRMDNIMEQLQTIRPRLESFEEQLREGNFCEDHIDLLEPVCLENKSLSVYFTKFTSFVKIVSETDLTANELIQSSRLISLELERPGVDDILQRSLVDLSQVLQSKRMEILRLKAKSLEFMDNIQQVDGISSHMHDCMTRLKTAIGELREAILQTQWLGYQSEDIVYLDQDVNAHSSPLIEMNLNDREQLLNDIRLTYELQVISPLSRIGRIPSRFPEYLKIWHINFREYLDGALGMSALLSRLSDQSLSMKTMEFDVRVLEARMGRFNKHLEIKYVQIMTRSHDIEDIFSLEDELQSRMISLRIDTQEFLDTLNRRIPLIAIQSSHISELDTTALDRSAHLSSTIDAVAIDEAVRLRCSACAARLSGHLRMLEEKMKNISDLTTKAKNLDSSFSCFVSAIKNLTLQQDAIALKLAKLEELSLVDKKNTTSLDSMIVFKEEAETTISSHQSEVESLCLSARQAFVQLLSWKQTDGETIPTLLLESRSSTMGDIEQQTEEFIVKTMTLKAHLNVLVNSSGVSVHPQSSQQSRQPDQIEGDAQYWLKDNSSSYFWIPLSNVDEEGYITEYNSNPHNITPAFIPPDQLKEKIDSVRSRLHQISSGDLADAINNTQYRLLTVQPSEGNRSFAMKSLTEISEEIQHMMSSVSESTAATTVSELLYLSRTADTLLKKVQRLEHFERFSISVRACDNDLSDLLNFIDNYETMAPEGVEYHSNLIIGPEKQMLDRLGHSESLLNCMLDLYRSVHEDPSVVLEHGRILQTWSELKEMALERVNGTTSPTASSRSYYEKGMIDLTHAQRSEVRKPGGYGRLSVASSRTKDGFLTPSTPKRSVSNSNTELGDISPVNVRLKKRSNRSVSGPMTSSLYSSTFSSRQRTVSMTSTSSIVQASVNLKSGRISSLRAGSPAYSDSSYKSNIENSTRPKPQSATIRTPKVSLKSIYRDLPKQDGSHRSRQKYIANPDNKLDVAVGNVVNRLPVDINIQVVADTWKDQSGKYWIGDADPRLCFCRILRSQTVMVRVGGGWTELSKFIQSHFTDLFDLIPKPHASVKIAEDSIALTPERPITPEAGIPDIPFFTLSTPNNSSPRSPKSTSSPGSSLTPLQFMRRADVDAPDLNSLSLSKGNTSRSKGSNAFSTPSRTAVWRP